ncbi:MAG: septum formation protein Maf, partial [Bacilli bacterium]|nr:septum formation protein Maf [Bacilli bacterium]
GWEYETIGADIDEVIDPGKLPEDIAEELAYEKALHVFKKHRERIVIGFDTLVYTDTHIFGKPKDQEDAKRMLRELSGRDHYVVTGVSILAHKMSRTFNVKTRVRFYPLDEAEISSYVSSNEPMDKAGAYAAQGLGAKFINEIDGDFFTVVGIPLSRIYQEIKEMQLLD